MSVFSAQYYCEFDRFFSVKIEDDGRVAYAYLMQGNDEVADVWLYNLAAAPVASFWNEADKPFVNPC
ncbi:hypothetical protein [Mucilaginibacter sp.]|uniref:hypothetical protein n=1 Tax=Mucilaginibacter sp. TaxID=1882438 RepID=UPI0035BC78B4